MDAHDWVHGPQSRLLQSSFARQAIRRSTRSLGSNVTTVFYPVVARIYLGARQNDLSHPQAAFRNHLYVNVLPPSAPLFAYPKGSTFTLHRIRISQTPRYRCSRRRPRFPPGPRNSHRLHAEVPPPRRFIRGCEGDRTMEVRYLRNVPATRFSSLNFYSGSRSISFPDIVPLVDRCEVCASGVGAGSATSSNTHTILSRPSMSRPSCISTMSLNTFCPPRRTVVQ